ncbi:MAG: hypothetical protein JNK53_06705 [Phycisphaerae bacterium]|nr:hypothetical protein [Phycisphaerae bacterium]
MTGALYLAWRSALASWGRNALIAVALGVAAGLPIAAGSALQGVQAALHARAESTPLVAGPKGSPLDLVLRATEFTAVGGALPTLPARDFAPLESGALVMPMVLGAHARGVPIVGSTVEYMQWRGLRAEQGRLGAMLGECVAGTGAALRLGIGTQPGADSLTTSPDQVYSVAGSYPVRLRVVGVLAPTGTADDDVVHVSNETAWVIAGLGHGHQRLGADAPVDQLLRKDAANVTASAAVREFIEVTPENAQRFHFHGDAADFPVHAAIVVPRTSRDAALLLGRAESTAIQVVRPAEVIDGLFARVFRVRDLLSVVFLVVVGAALLLAGTQLALLVRLRAPQMQLLRRVGASQAFIVGMVAFELALVVAAAVGVAGTMVWFAPILQPLLRSSVA